MAQLLLRGVALGEVKGVLFDKDGTLSISEPQLITLAEARVFLCLERVDPALHGELRQLLRRAYGLRRGSAAPGNSICPAGITAVASRDHNLIATATALVQVGLGWPEALSLSEQVFALADQLDARRAANTSHTIPSDAATAVTDGGEAGPAMRSGESIRRNEPTAVERVGGATPTIRCGEASAPIHAGAATAASCGSAATTAAGAAPSHPSECAAAPDEGHGCAAGMEAEPAPAGVATHLASGGLPAGGTSRTTEGLRAWLEQLRSASVVCAVISNDDVAGIEHFLASHGLTEFFAAIWSAEHRPRKPDPNAVHGLCAELGLTAADCALIGDANSDLRMAVAAGIPHQLALGYTAAWSTPPPLAEPHPRVHHWRELGLA